MLFFRIRALRNGARCSEDTPAEDVYPKFSLLLSILPVSILQAVGVSPIYRLSGHKAIYNSAAFKDHDSTCTALDASAFAIGLMCPVKSIAQSDLLFTASALKCSGFGAFALELTLHCTNVQPCAYLLFTRNFYSCACSICNALEWERCCYG